MMNYDLMVQLRYIVTSGTRGDPSELAYAAYRDIDAARRFLRESPMGGSLHIVDRLEGTYVA